MRRTQLTNSKGSKMQLTSRRRRVTLSDPDPLIYAFRRIDLIRATVEKKTLSLKQQRGEVLDNNFNFICLVSQNIVLPKWFYLTPAIGLYMVL
jgi:hypothetical protein